VSARAHSSRELRLLAGAVCLSAGGDVLALITLALAVHGLTGSGLAVSALFATTLVPAVALAPLAGLVADRVESVRVLVLASLLQCAVAAALAFSGGLVPILLLSLLLAAGTTFSQPAEFALVPAVARGEELTRVNGLMESARYAGFALGPLLAGALSAAGGSRLALLVNAASFLAIAAAGALLRTRRPPPAAREAGERAGEGFALLWRDRTLRVSVLACTAALAFISASMTIDVFYVKEVLHAGDGGYALVFAAWMLGMVGGAMKLAGRVPAPMIAVCALLALTAQGAGVAAQTAWAVLPSALAGYFVGGVGHGVKNTLMRTLIQRRVAESAHGRAFAAYSAARNSAELGALAAGGVLVSAIGPRPALLVAGLGPVVAGLAGLGLLGRRRSPAQRRSWARKKSVAPALPSAKGPRRALPAKRPSTLTALGPSESSPSVAKALSVDCTVQTMRPLGETFATNAARTPDATSTLSPKRAVPLNEPVR
jgi:MFS family permease